MDDYVVIPTNNTSLGLNTANIKVLGKDIVSEHCQISLNLSKDAIIGFATYAIRTSIKEKSCENLSFQVEPLNNPKGNQPLGFFLTNESPSFILNCTNSNQNTNNMWNCKEIEDPNSLKFQYRVPLYPDDKTFEAFEIGMCNVGEIIITNSNGENITHNCTGVVLRIDIEGLYKFGEGMFKIAHQFKPEAEYKVCSFKEHENYYNMGIILDDKSSTFKINCCNMKNVYFYEPYYGT